MPYMAVVSYGVHTKIHILRLRTMQSGSFVMQSHKAKNVRPFVVYKARL